MSALIRLYPPGWRKRYEAEFVALLEARPPTLYDRFDIVRGAVDARLHPQVRESESPEPSPVVEGPDDTVVVRRLGYAAIVGAAAWLFAWWYAAVGAPVVYDGYGPHRDGTSIAIPVLMLSMFLLVGGLIGHMIVLPGGRKAARAGAIAAIPLLILWSFGPWIVWFGLGSLIALVTFAVGSLRAPHWPVAAAAGVIVGIVGVVGLGVAVAGLVNLGNDIPYEALFVITATATPIWLAVGGPLTRVRPSVPAA
jgi:hypothetical protein